MARPRAAGRGDARYADDWLDAHGLPSVRVFGWRSVTLGRSASSGGAALVLRQLGHDGLGFRNPVGVLPSPLSLTLSLPSFASPAAICSRLLPWARSRREDPSAGDVRQPVFLHGDKFQHLEVGGVGLELFLLALRHDLPGIGDQRRGLLLAGSFALSRIDVGVSASSSGRRRSQVAVGRGSSSAGRGTLELLLVAGDSHDALISSIATDMNALSTPADPWSRPPRGRGRRVPSTCRPSRLL